jgi:molecular chaperone GrpE (heat shock protein)
MPEKTPAGHSGGPDTPAGDEAETLTGETSSAAPPGEERASGDDPLNFTGLGASLAALLKGGQPPDLAAAPRERDPREDTLEELAEDMVEVLSRLKALEERQQDHLRLTEQLRQEVNALNLTHGREIDALRRDLLGQRQALAALDSFKAIAPWLDSLRHMHRKFHPKRDVKMRQHLQPVINALALAIQGLGFEEFQAQVGENFDPRRMSCTGYAKGEAGVVLGLDHPGYRVGEVVVRPAGVILAAPK